MTPSFVTDLPTARQRVADTQARLAARAAGFRPPPPEPTTCCGRGCNGCVWEGYYEALNRWLDESAALIS